MKDYSVLSDLHTCQWAQLVTAYDKGYEQGYVEGQNDGLKKLNADPIGWITKETPPDADVYLVSWKIPLWEQTSYIGICEWDGTRWLVEDMPQAKQYKERIIITAWADVEVYKGDEE